MPSFLGNFNYTKRKDRKKKWIFTTSTKMHNPTEITKFIRTDANGSPMLSIEFFSVIFLHVMERLPRRKNTICE